MAGKHQLSRPHMVRRVLAPAAVVLAAAMLFGTTMLASAQISTPIRADAIVLVNSNSPRYSDFAHYVQPYLDHFGVPYTIQDISTTPVSTTLSNYALIIIGHNGLDYYSIPPADPVRHYDLSVTAEYYITTAVSLGTGLINFDYILEDNVRPNNHVPIYQYIQDIFAFGYGDAEAASVVTVNSSPAVGNYIVGLQPTNATYTLGNGIKPIGVTLPARAATLATIATDPPGGSYPLLIATTYGQGRAVQWTTYEWQKVNPTLIWGYAHGFDDLIWRGMAWAARKPFVLQGLPPFVTMRVDDVGGPFGWADAAINHGFKPWGGVFLDTVQDISHLKQLVDARNMTVQIHARSGSLGFYYDVAAEPPSPLSDTQVDQNFIDGTNWFSTNQIISSTFVAPHYYEFGTNVFAGLRNWGVQFVGTVITPDTAYGSPMLNAGPFMRYEAPQDSTVDWPLYYADYLTVPNHPELNGQFFDVLTEARDGDGVEWFPTNNVTATIRRGVSQLDLALSGMEVATLFTHEQNITPITADNWNAILSGVTSGIASYHPEYVTMDYAAQYVRAMHTSYITSSIYDPATRVLTTTLTGSTDLPTRFYLFTGQGETINSSFINVPTFTTSTVVITRLSPTAVAVSSFSATPAGKQQPGWLQAINSVWQGLVSALRLEAIFKQTR